MLIRNKKNKLNTALLAGSILLSAQAVKPTANAASVVTQSIKDNNIVAHAADSVSTGAIGVDTASYQDTDLTKYKNAGAQFAIVKLTEGTSYVNPKGTEQYASAQANGLMTMAYFFATFGTDSQEALNEARFFVQHAQAMGIPRGSYLAVDYESGDGNNFSTTDRTANTNAILNAMNYIRLSGYQPLIYTGQNFMDNYIDEARLSEHYPNSEWIAAYTQGYKASDEPIFDWKPPYPNMVMWQFTPNFNGQKTDASVAIQNMKNKPDMEAVIDSEGKGLNGSEVRFLPDGTYRALAAPLVNYDGNIGTDNSGAGDNTDTGTSGNSGVDENTGSPNVGDNTGTDVNGSAGDSGTNNNVSSPSAGDNIGADMSGNTGNPNIGENTGDSSVDISGTNGNADNSNISDTNNGANNSNAGDSSVDISGTNGNADNSNISGTNSSTNNSNTDNSSISSGTGNSDNTTENEHEGHGWNGSMSSVAFKKGFSHSENNVGNTGSNVGDSNKNNSNVINLLPEDNNDNVVNNQPLPSDKKEQEVKNEKIAQANNQQDNQSQNNQQSQQNEQNQNNQQNQNLSNDLGNSSDSTNSDLAQTSTNKDKQNIWIDLFGLSAMSLGLMKLQKKDDAE